MPIIYRDSSTWPGAAKQDGAFLLPETLPAKESAAVLIELIFGPPYQQIIATQFVEAVLVRRQSIRGGRGNGHSGHIGIPS